MPITQEFTVQGRGIGKPDYTRGVSRAIQRAGVSLEYRQSLKWFARVYSAVASAFPWVTTELAPGASDYLVDAETGLPMPYTLLEGYTISVIQDSFGFSEDCDIVVNISVPPIPGTQLAAIINIGGGGTEIYRNRVVPLGTESFDPTGSSSHDVEVILTNTGLGNLRGAIDVVAMLSEVGTEPLPSVKTVRCRVCSHQWSVPCNQTTLICPECGNLTVVYDLTRFRRTS